MDEVPPSRSLFERQGVLLRAIQKQTRLRNRTMDGQVGRVVHLVTTRPDDAPADDSPSRRFTVATVAQIGSHTSRPVRAALRPRDRGERDDRVD